MIFICFAVYYSPVHTRQPMKTMYYSLIYATVHPVSLHLCANLQGVNMNFLGLSAFWLQKVHNVEKSDGGSEEDQSDSQESSEIGYSKSRDMDFEISDAESSGVELEDNHTYQEWYEQAVLETREARNVKFQNTSMRERKKTRRKKRHIEQTL